MVLTEKETTRETWTSPDDTVEYMILRRPRPLDGVGVPSAVLDSGSFDPATAGLAAKKRRQWIAFGGVMAVALSMIPLLCGASRAPRTAKVDRYDEMVAAQKRQQMEKQAAEVSQAAMVHTFQVRRQSR